MTPLQKLIEESEVAEKRAHSALQTQIDSIASWNTNIPIEENHVRKNYTDILAGYIAKAAYARQRLRKKQQDDESVLFVEKMLDKAQGESYPTVEVGRSDLFRLASIAQERHRRDTNTEKS